MAWYHYIAYVFGGIFLANAIPHYVRGVCGLKFPTPFANPPGKGESSPGVNVIWGLANLLVGFLLLQPGHFALALNFATLAFAVGFVFMSVLLFKHFGGLYSPHE